MSTDASAPSARPQAPGAVTGGYQLSRPQGKCVACGQDIAPDARFMAALRETPQGFERLDVCRACWDTFDRSALLGFWQTLMPRPEQKKKLFVDDEVLCNLFERLAETTEPAKLSFRFVLGLILMRKRLILYESTRQDAERELWQVRFRGRDDMLDLLNPKLNEQQVLEVSQQLAEILNEEL